MESQIVTEFVEKTGCELELAYTLLQSKYWDFNAALLDWKYLNEEQEQQDLYNIINHPSTSTSILNYNKKLSRGISRATDNLPIVLRARNEIENDNNIIKKEKNEDVDVDVDEDKDKENKYIIKDSEYTFILPDLNNIIINNNIELIEFIENDLIERSTLISLESTNRLNWWLNNYNIKLNNNKLYPLITNGDGNCLLHAASLSIWGFHDRLLTLRIILYKYILNQNNTSELYRRWRYQQTIINQQNNLILTDDEWLNEWLNIIKMSSNEINNKNNNNNNNYHSLEEIHVLALSIILNRPIIIISNTILNDLNGEPLSPITFGGIYLPYNNNNINNKSPILFTYDNGHFSSLILMNDNNNNNNILIPIVDFNNYLLPIQYNYDPGFNVDWNQIEYINYNDNYNYNINILKKYINIIEIDNNKQQQTTTTVIKQFGSIGKNMSKKLKKNLNKIINNTNNTIVINNKLFKTILCCKLNIIKHKYQNDMIQNYLQFINKRFNLEQQQITTINKCINCNKLNNTIDNSYMLCVDCYYLQYNKEINNIIKKDDDDGPKYGIGKSKFYTNNNNNITITTNNNNNNNLLNNINPTLYLSKSTFYNDTGTKLFNNKASNVCII